ncbi:MAG TPA: YfiR family protein [Desulfuromonadales bacterium]|nr:YfiR family protein [Desulfuromonadales bacterium]
MKLCLCAMLFFIVLQSTYSLGQGDVVPQEYQIKARYLLNIPLFTEMPPQLKKDTSYTVCLIGDTPLESVLEAFRGTLINNRPLTLQKIEDLSQMGSCQMLFIGSSERHRLQALLPEAQRRGILTISDMRDFARSGGMVSLQTVNNKVTFDLNLSAANKASITFSTHLLKLARDIIK